MTNTEYIARVVKFYSKNKVKLGRLTFDKHVGRFVIRTINMRKAITAPEDGIHCGDIYILREKSGKWKIGQCEIAKDHKWKFLGTDVTEDSIDEVLILYVNGKRLIRLSDDFLDETFDLGELSEMFVEEWL